MTEYRPEHERMLWGLGLSGNAFKKVYYDPAIERQISLYVPAEDLIVPYGASNLDTAERVTHVMRKSKNEVIKLQASGFYRDVDLGEPTKGNLDEVEKKIAENMGFSATSDDRFKILEVHVDLDLSEYDEKDSEAGDEETEMGGIALPYVVTIEKSTQTVLAIYRNWAPNDEKKLKREHFVHYPYIPGFGFYAFGLVHLLGSFAKSGTSLIRQLVDAGTLSNLPGGLKSRGLRVKGDDTPIAPGEFRDVDVPSGSIKDNILPLPYKEPSQVLFSLFQQIVTEGRAFASSGDMKVSDMSSQAPVGTTLAILERTLKVMTAVQARIHNTMKQEFKLLKVIIADYCPEEYEYQPVDGSRRARKSDYDLVDVIPVSDPNAATMAQKIVTYQAVLQLAQTAPQLYDLPLLHRQMIEILGVKNAAKLVPIEDDATPIDPIQENQNLLTMKPTKAFLEQNHQAHIAVHMSAIQNPKIQAMLQQNPQAQAIMASFMAHVNEHVAFQYRIEIEQMMGVPLPPMEDKNADEKQHIPREIADQVAMMAAQASQQLLQRDTQQAQQQAAQQQMQDPVVQMQMQELQLKQQDLQLKAQKQAMEAQAKEQQLQIEAARISAQKEIAAMQVAANSATQRDKLVRQTAIDAAKLTADAHKHREKTGADMQRHREQMAHQRQQSATQAQKSQTPQKENK
jgi:hypothetical protein